MDLRTPTTFRINPSEKELLDAWASYLRFRGVRGTQSDVIRFLMREAQPPEASEPEALRVRTAYRAIFGSRTP